jgi:iron complex outermembrane recepter protein
MKLINIITMVALTIVSKISTAQYKISGNIKDINTQENLIGVSVYNADLKFGVVTNENGDFKIENLKPNTYLLEFTILGYAAVIKRVEIKKDTIINVQLFTAILELNEVVVTGVTRSTELKLSPVIIKAIDKTALNQNSATNLIDALKNVPGVSQISTGAAISKPIIRGLGYNRVISLYNGIRQEGQQWGDEHGIEIDEYDIDRIEIVKGAGSLMYGSDGIAGVLNFLSPKSPNLGEVKSQLISNYQTNNNLIGTSVSNAGNKKGLQWLSRISNKFSSNYQNKFDGRVFNSGFKEIDGSLFIGINRNWGHSHFNLSSFNTVLNLPEGDRDNTGKFIFVNTNGTEKTATKQDLQGYKVGFPHQGINHLRLSVNNYFIFNKGTLNADFAIQNNKRKEFADIENPKDIALFFDLTTFSYNTRYNLKRINGWETSFGIGGMQQSNVNKGLEFLIPAYNLFDIGTFIFTQKTFNSKLTFASGLRFDNRTMNVKKLILNTLGQPTNIEDATSSEKFKGFKQNYNGISGSAGISYQLDKKSTLKINLSRGFRAPSIAELASNGRHEGTFRYEIGTQNLKSEISHQFDVAYFLNSEHLTFEITPFANFISNYIYTEKLKDLLGNDIIPDPSDPAPAYKFVQGNATLLGSEFYLDIHPHPLDWLHIENAFSFVQATQSKQPDSSKYLPFIPAPKYRLELKAQFNAIGKSLSNIYFKIAIDHFFKQDKIFSAFGTETKTPSYTLLSAGIGTNVIAFKKKDFMSLFISAENLSNIAYQSHLSRLKYAPDNLATGRTGIFNMGRNISLKLIFNL